MNDSAYVPSRPEKREWLAVFTILPGVFLLNIFTYALYPTVWNDDILWAEPAINLVRTGHFTTSVWQLQPANAFWAAQSPFYPLVFSVWLKLFGFSLLAVKSFNFMLVSVAVFMVWIGSWKFRLVGQASIRLIMVAVLLFGYGISFTYRSARPDICGLISLLSLGMAFGLKDGRRKDVLVFICAALAPWVGVQIGLYVCSAVFLGKIFFPKMKWRHVVLVWAAVGVGAGGVLALYAQKGVLPDFMASLHQAADEQNLWTNHTSYLTSVSSRVSSALYSYIADFSAVPLILGLIGIYRFVPNLGAETRKFRYLLALFLVIPWIFSFSAHIAFYYSYMLYVPLVLAFSLAYSNTRLAGTRRRIVNLMFAVCAAGAILLGLPSRLLLCGISYRVAPRSVVQEVIKEHVQPQDVVFVDYSDFFEAKQCAQRVFIPAYSTNFVKISARGHDFSPEEKKQISVLIVPPELEPRLENYFGCRWKPVSEPFGDTLSLEELAKLPVVGSRIQHHFSTPQMVRYQFRVYRRDDETPNASASSVKQPELIVPRH
jgi:hypothetical protein